MLKASIVGLIILLIFVIVYQYYKISEGFILGGPRIIATPQLNGEFIDISANTTDGTTIYGVKILYSYGIHVLSPGQSTDSSLALDLVVSPTPFPITNKPINAMKNRHKYYFVTSDVVKYTEGETPLLGSFIYDDSIRTPSSSSSVAHDAQTDVQSRGDDDPEIEAEKEQLDQLIKASIQASPETRMAKEKQQKQELLRDIQQIVKNEIAAKKSMTTGAQAFFQQNPDGSSIYSDGSQSEKQGCEMYGVRPKWCPKDMNDYIRKDSIPCWGCTLDY